MDIFQMKTGQQVPPPSIIFICLLQRKPLAINRTVFKDQTTFLSPMQFVNNNIIINICGWNIPTGSPARGLKSAKSPLAFADVKSAKPSLFSDDDCFLC